MIRDIFKNKLFYIVLAIAFIVNVSMDFNATYNQDLLDAYYQSPGVVADVDQRNGVRDNLVSWSMHLLGTPYKYAGKGPDVFDCSGFTGYVFRKFNVDLPATSALQARFGQKRLLHEIQKGDLLVFKSPAKGVDRVGHVGIVVSNENGKINFIHSSTSNGVTIDSLNHPHYNDRYMEARNVLK